MFVHKDFLNLLFSNFDSQEQLDKIINEMTIGNYLKKYGKISPILNKQLYFSSVNNIKLKPNENIADAIKLFKVKKFGHIIIRDENSKNILAIFNRNDLLLFILRNFYPIDKDNILKTPIKEFKISRKFECIFCVNEDEQLINVLKYLKEKKVNLISCQLSLLLIMYF